MSISLCVIAKHSPEGFGRLIDAARPVCSQIVVALDDGYDPMLECYEGVLYLKRALGMDFAAQRNFLLDHARCEWALHLDTDENLTTWMWDHIRGICDSTKEDLILLPRRTKFIGRPEIECCWPDWQPKLHRNKPEIRWVRPVHEWPEGQRSQFYLPAEPPFAIHHLKTPEAQEQANQLYAKILLQ